MHSTPRNDGRPASKRDVIKLAREQNVRFVRLVFADIFGVSKNVSIPVGELENALEGRVTFDGGSIDGFVRGEELDMLLRPDPSTFAIYPWPAPDGREARLICDIAMPDGEPFEGCPRTTLRRSLESATSLNGLRVGLEAEFFLFDKRADNGESTTTGDVGSYFDFSANDRGETARNAIVAALQSMERARRLGASRARRRPARDRPRCRRSPCGGRSRVDAAHASPSTSLPASISTRPSCPSPSRTAPGTDCTSISPRAGSDDATALYVVGGLLAHAPAVTAVCNPTVNSYKRLVAAWDAPIYTVWSERSANALVRVPPGQTPPRVEMRSPDPACNPYLALAVLIGAAADGIARSTLPGPALAGSTYDLGERERRERGIGMLPRSLRQAIDELDADPVVRAALGDHLYHAFRDAKLAEYERYRRAVHPWELEQYLRLY